LRVGITYNIRKEPDISENILQTGIQPISINGAEKFLDENLVKNYPDRIDDTFAEWDSIETIEAVRDALQQFGHETDLIEADKNAFAKLSDLNNDIVFNIAEGFGGASRESQIPSMLEMLGIPFTGSDSITTGICHDKSRCKEILSYYGIPNAPFFITDDENISITSKIFPKFVKPMHEGSSKGIYNSSVVTNESELRSEISRIRECYCQPAIVEDYLQGREFTVAMLGNGDSAKVLPIVEINLDSVPEGFNKIYSYEVKWFFDTRESKLEIFRCPAKISSSLYGEIEKVCLDAYRNLRIRDWARIDVRLDSNNVPNIVEINPLPGILPDPADNSCYPKAARHSGLDYNEMINSVLNEAVKRSNQFTG
jgi:D-alanine-D-alanine ligase